MNKPPLGLILILKKDDKKVTYKKNKQTKKLQCINKI